MLKDARVVASCVCVVGVGTSGHIDTLIFLSVNVCLVLFCLRRAPPPLDGLTEVDGQMCVFLALT